MSKKSSFKDFNREGENTLLDNLREDGYLIVENGSANIVHYNVDIETGNPQALLNEVKEAWKDSKDILAISSPGIKQREIQQFLENIFSTTVTPVAPGMFYIFKNSDQRENYLYSIQRRSVNGNVAMEKEDLLVYLALARFRSENVTSNLPEAIQENIKLYHGNFLKAVSLSKKLLFSTGDKKNIIDLCKSAPAGVNDTESFYIHSSAVPDLDPTLRVFIGMAGIFYGDINNSDIIKIHKNSIKISFYNYDDFNNKLLPELHSRIKIDLAKQQMNFYNHKSKNNQQLLYFKDKYVLETHPAYQKWKTFSETLKSKGIKEIDEYGPSKQELEKLLDKEFIKQII
ncbi:DNA phosphorothioation-associated putative methyltransferase [Candidatus Bathyarchaeota archaeon]|nr:DNA phosphorothioation-associated putative methyltransferase [Candidatus Bathyarchaeota archaeon]MBN2617126.1 DNA phosphorothioation-associated putative methyltransferase [Spirochaetales bacterium]